MSTVEQTLDYPVHVVDHSPFPLTASNTQALAKIATGLEYTL